MQINSFDTHCPAPALFEKYFSQRPHCFFLDSGMDPQKLGRFSFMGAEPFLVLKTKGRLIEVSEYQGVKVSKTKRFIGDPFAVLKELLRKYKNDFYSDDVPFLGGAVGYFSYDLCHFIEKLPSTAIDDIGAPDLYLGFYDKIVAVDHMKNKTYGINLRLQANNCDPETLEPRTPRPASCPTCRGGHNLEPRTYNLEPKPPRPASCPTCRGGHNLEPNIQSNFLKESYIAAINKAKDYIRQGDIYQVNLSQRFITDLTIPAFELYKRLRGINPAPFAAYLGFDDAQVVSASPERFLKIDAKSRYIETRPIKGTRPRGRTSTEDAALERELAGSAKDRAEHIMIVDLERNDLGRVCEYGSVKWSEPMVSERYATVHHLVSTVSGALRKDADAVDCLTNCFPGGSITGAPKIRSMEVIDELEPTKRSVYTGAIGYIGFNGNMDTSIVIRTFIVKGDKLYFQAGGGIVADSQPEAEYQETLDKAAALVQALGITRDAIACGSWLAET